MSDTNDDLDFNAALRIQKQLASVFAGNGLGECMLVLENEIANIILLHGKDLQDSLNCVEAVCGDIRKIIAARFAETAAALHHPDTGARH